MNSEHSDSDSLRLRYMRSADIADVVVIDRASFDPAWSARSYQFEILESPCSYMVVLEQRVPQPVQGLRRLFQAMRGDQDTTEEQVEIMAYGGLWNIQEEAHISTIASHPAHRGKGFGEIVLAGMIRRSIELKAGYIVLEVRVSNKAAQQLYRKYGFEIVGTKPDYYRNNHEDAYDMRLMLDRPQVLDYLAMRYQQIQELHPFTDAFSQTLHPRLGK